MPTRPPVFRPSWAPTPQQRQRDYNQDRGSPSKRGYGRDWQKVRAAHLAAHPVCLFCEQAGRVKAADVVDHIKPICDAPELRLDPTNLRSLCFSHHNQRTARESNRRHWPTP